MGHHFLFEFKEKPTEFLNTLAYEVKKEYSLRGANDLVYKKFLLTHRGKDNIKGTGDDALIDTHKVIKQPEGFGLIENVFFEDDLSE